MYPACKVNQDVRSIFQVQYSQIANESVPAQLPHDSALFEERERVGRDLFDAAIGCDFVGAAFFRHGDELVNERLNVRAIL